jgi:DNA replication and repair protein RecF
MILKDLSLRDFRSYETTEYAFSPDVNIICGDNGRGKTNLLEAIFLLTGVRSWRAAKKAELVRWDVPKAELKATVETRGRQFQLKLDMPASGRSQVWVNGVKKQRQLELSECLRCVLFSPEDLYLIKGPASGRRDFLDGAISQIRPRYGDLLARYEKLLDSKSRLLKMEEPRPSAELIAAYDDQLAHIGAHLMGYRAKFCRGLGEECGNMHAAISGGKETLTLQYKTVSTVTDPFAEPSVIEGQLRDHLESHRLAELQSGSCLSGLHKDDVELFLNGRPAKAFASQGQTRSAALALKFGQRELFFRDTGEYPVLLLDDVLSELDAPRQAFVATHAMGGQSIITCCEERQEFQNSNLILL